MSKRRPVFATPPPFCPASASRLPMVNLSAKAAGKPQIPYSVSWRAGRPRTPRKFENHNASIKSRIIRQSDPLELSQPAAEIDFFEQEVEQKRSHKQRLILLASVFSCQAPAGRWQKQGRPDRNCLFQWQQLLSARMINRCRSQMGSIRCSCPHGLAYLGMPMFFFRPTWSRPSSPSRLKAQHAVYRVGQRTSFVSRGHDQHRATYNRSLTQKRGRIRTSHQPARAYRLKWRSRLFRGRAA